MSKDLGVSGPVEIKDNSKERVAFDLMAVIVNNESRAKQERSNRNYWLTLYSQCLKATSNYALESILKEQLLRPRMSDPEIPQ